MTNTQSLGTIEATNPVLTVAPLKEDTEMLRATDKISALLPLIRGRFERR